MTEESQPWKLSDRIWNLGSFFGTVLKEIFDGVRKDRIPAHRYCYLGIFIALGLVAHIDERIARFYHWKNHLPIVARAVLTYGFLTSGWLIWGCRQAFQRNEVLTKLAEAFESAKLKCNGRYPSLVEDVALDSHRRRIRLKTNGVTLSEVVTNREKIEAALNTTIIRVTQEPGDKSRMDIVYSDKDLPREAFLSDREKERLVDAQIPIGLTHAGPIAVNLREIAHLLVAGTSGGGKSNFLKVVSSILAKNNPESEVYFLDFKGGMESADLREAIENMQDNVRYFDGTRKCAQELARLGTVLDLRLQYLAESGAPTLDEYQKASLARNASNQFKVKDMEKRCFVVIDELAQLSAKEPGVEKEVLANAKAALNRIARQGRAAGVHLIIATQKPDAANFDQTVKANLPAVLCFPMATQGASVSAVGTKRAYELNPDIKGRAVWKFGPKFEEVQTYLFT